jgi:hypothetical protein
MLRVILTYQFLLLSFFVLAQNKTIPALEREVSLKASDEPASSVLNKIATQTGIKFSYSPTTIPVEKRISLTVKKKPVRTVLRIVFGDGIQYKQKGDFIILTSKTIPAVEATIKEITISGYVYDENGDKLTSASILSKSEHLSAVTNKYGYYKMSVPVNRFPVKIKIEKEHYIDTILTISSNQTDVDIILTVPRKVQPQVQPIVPVILLQDTPEAAVTAIDTIALSTDTATIDTSQKQTFKKALENIFFVSDETRANIRNIKDTLFTKVQFSLIPYVSTNKLLAGNTVNEVSFNLLAGYSQGVKIAEFGGLVNVDRGDVQYFQGAGLMNVVGGNVKGAQMAGMMNINAGSGEGFRSAGLMNIGNNMDGVQLAGLINISADYKSGYTKRSLRGLAYSKVKGIQAAGLLNVNAGTVEGISLAGLYNAAYNTTGVQCAGLINGNLGYMHGVQAAGLINITVDTSTGVHLAGMLNMNGRRSEGIHIAGFSNITLGDVEGVQIASMLNIARNMKGMQLALFNFSDTCVGVPIGLMSLSRRGYHKIEVFGDEVINTQMAFRTGVPYFHNIFTAGIDMTRRADGLWCFGYGFGSTIPFNDKWKFTADALSQVILIKDRIDESPQLISLFIGTERAFGKRFSIAFGPVGRLMISEGANNPDSEYTRLNSKLVPYSFYDKTHDNGNRVQMWVGGKLSLKFL